ncbi:hypothetical protein T310_8809, partial [Rasamsonia emersonii CBS 393.64]
FQAERDWLSDEAQRCACVDVKGRKKWSVARLVGSGPGDSNGGGGGGDSFRSERAGSADCQTGSTSQHGPGGLNLEEQRATEGPGRSGSGETALGRAVHGSTISDWALFELRFHGIALDSAQRTDRSGQWAGV